jgi:site-specific recombinase XerD
MPRRPNYNHPDLEKLAEILKSERPEKTCTVSRYVGCVRKFLEWAEENGIDILENPQKIIQEYINEKVFEEGWTRQTVNVTFYALKKYYEKIHYTEISKKFFTNIGKPTKYYPTVLSKREVRTIFEEAENLPLTHRCMIHVGWEAALRSSELVTLKGKHFANHKVYVIVKKTRKPKVKNVPLSDYTWNMVQQLITSDNKYVFYTKPKDYEFVEKRRRWLPGEWSSWFGDWTEEILGKRVRWHNFARHTRLTFYAEETKNFMKVLLLSGHSSPMVALQYFEMARVTTPEIEELKKRLGTYSRFPGVM